MYNKPSCRVVLEKQILLENIASQQEDWEKVFITKMENFNYKFRFKTQTGIIFNKEWKKKIRTLIKSRKNDLWVYYRISFHVIVKLIIALCILFLGLFDIGIVFFMINLHTGSYFPSSLTFIPMLFIVNFVPIMVVIFLTSLKRGYGKVPNQNIIIDIRTAAKEAMKKIKKNIISKQIGKSRKELRYCPSCGNKINPDWNFCPFCEKSLV
ncbi:MAG: hypothetical protein GF329_07085 [Candidatus Lokiarchaeota archaeon]|nr:hypothetical protein [Candidatus Lokiarchaeota archaeon]